MLKCKIKHYVSKKELLVFYELTNSGEKQWLRDDGGSIFFLLITEWDLPKYFRSFWVGSKRYKMGGSRNKLIKPTDPEYCVVEQIKHKLNDTFDWVSCWQALPFEQKLVLPR